MNKKSVCVLVSGGLDSDVLLAELASQYHRVWPVYIQQGLAWEKIELYWLRRFLSSSPRKRGSRGVKAAGPRLTIRRGDVKPLSVFSLPMADLYGAHWSTGHKSAPGARSKDAAVYLPGRNMILSVKAAVFCSQNRISDLAIGSLDHNPFPDASMRFFQGWGKTLGQGLNHPIRILAPYRQLSKVQVIQRGKSLPLHLSFSCISPKGNFHCGRCNKCSERRRAFEMAKVEDKTRYAKA